MKKFFNILIWVALGIAFVLLIVFLFNKEVFSFANGGFEFSWQKLTMLFALGFGPLKLLFRSKEKKLAAITSQHQALRAIEEKYRENLDKDIKEKEYQVTLLNKDLELMDTKLQLLEAKKKNIGKTVNNMLIEDKKTAFTKYFGN